MGIVRLTGLLAGVVVVSCLGAAHDSRATVVAERGCQSTGPSQTIAPISAGANQTQRVISRTVADVPDYDWWYGCSPTSAGMVVGYYDRNGYQPSSNEPRRDFSNLVGDAGVVAESTTFVSTPGQWDFAVQSSIASQGHVADFYGGGYGASGDDVPSGRAFDSLADFMGTSQDAALNSNGQTAFFFATDNTRLHPFQLSAANRADSGAYGLLEYFDERGYDAGYVNVFNQYIFGRDGISEGFSYLDFANEINRSRPVMVHVEGHTMVGYGYQTTFVVDQGRVVDRQDLIYLRDTWNPGIHTMEWGGSYGGLQMLGVTVVNPYVVAEPGTLLAALGGLAGLGLAVMRRQRSSRGKAKGAHPAARSPEERP